MQFDILTIFPDFFRGPFDHGIPRRAVEKSLIGIRVHDLRAFATDRHRTVDDRPFGGGEGMVLKPEMIFAATEKILGELREAERRETAIVLLSAQGKLLNQSLTAELAARPRVITICGRYEGVDERVAEHLATHEISVGDYVLSGGELAAAIIVDVVTRLLPGALGDERSSRQESFTAAGSIATQDGPSSIPQSGTGILDYPQYTRPPVFRDWSVPQVLLSGNHEEIRLWRRKKALEKTLRNRPDLLARAELSAEDRRLLEDIRRELGTMRNPA